MDSIIDDVTDKENIRDGAITDGEQIFDTSAATTIASTTSTMTTIPVFVGELSSEIELSMANTNMQRSYSLQQHRMVSGVDDIVDTNNGVSHEALVTAANVVVADEEIPVANKVIEDDDDEEEDEDDYEYEDDDYAAFSGFIVNNNPAAGASFLTQTEIVSNSNNGVDSTVKPATIEEDVVADITDQLEDASQHISDNSYVNSKPKWRQPSEEAVSMSLRAEKETSGNKRRLALDLYRIMNQDTNLAGFTLVPKSEDCMDSWTIKLFQFDEDSKLAQDMKVLSVPYIELEMNFPDQYPFEPPFVRVTQPRFRRQTGFVMNGALCMELLTKDGWNPINDIESVIVSIRSLLVVGDGRLEAACALPEAKYTALLEAANQKARSSLPLSSGDDYEVSPSKKRKMESFDDTARSAQENDSDNKSVPLLASASLGGSYSVSEAQAAYSHLSDYHKKKGWDTSGWWARKG